MPSAVTVKYSLSPAVRLMQCSSRKSRQDFAASSHSCFLPYTRHRYENVHAQRPCIHTLLSVENTLPSRVRQV